MFRDLVGALLLGGVTLISSGAHSEELIVQIRPGVSESAVQKLSKEVGAEFQYPLGGPAYLIRVTPPQDADVVMDRLRSQKDVVSVERNQQVRIPE
jgi:hypothetical protein